MKPTPNDIHHALRSIENAERGEEHPRALARKAIAEWRSNAAKENLPVANVHDDKGARALDRDRVVKQSYPTYTTSDSKRSLWSKLFRRQQ